MNFSDANFESLIRRVEKLESQSRRWKFAAAVLSICCASLVLAGARLADRVDSQVIRARSVEAQDFVLKTEGGRVYARLSLNLDKVETHGNVSIVTRQTSGPALQFYDNDGEPVWTAPERPGIIPATR